MVRGWLASKDWGMMGGCDDFIASGAMVDILRDRPVASKGVELLNVVWYDIGGEGGSSKGRDYPRTGDGKLTW